MTDFQSRLEQLMVEHNVTQAQITKTVNTSRTSVSNWVSGKQLPSSESLLPLAKMFNVSPEWLLHGKVEGLTASAANEDSNGYVLIPKYDIKAACGTGFENAEDLLSGGLMFKEKWLRTKGYRPDKLAVIYLSGLSMVPTIAPDSVGLLDLSDSQPDMMRSGQVYAFVDGHDLRVKRVFYSFNRQELRLTSDNPDKMTYPDEVVTAEQARDIRLVGRVVWRGGDL